MDIIQGLECGADNFITKPYEPDYLIERVHQILERKAQQPQAKVRIEAEVLFLGKQFTISAEKEQILDLLFNTFEEMVKTNQELKTSQDRLAAAKAQLEQYAHQLEGQARTSEDKYSCLMEQANDGIFLLDPGGQVLEVNHRGRRVARPGQPAEIVGRPCVDFVPALKSDTGAEGCANAASRRLDLAGRHPSQTRGWPQCLDRSFRLLRRNRRRAAYPGHCPRCHRTPEVRRTLSPIAENWTPSANWRAASPTTSIIC